MRRIFIIMICASVLLGSCGTFTGSGAYTGSTLGSILGSAIGGISSGPRGSDIGTIVGMAGGAIIGGAIGANADKKRQDDIDQYRRDKEERAYRSNRRTNRQHGQQHNEVHGHRHNETYGQHNEAYEQQNDERTYHYEQQGKEESGFDATHSGDDRLYDFKGSDYTGTYSAQEPTTSLPQSSGVEHLAKGLTYIPAIEIRNARFVDDNQDNVISRGEICKVIFEIYNTGSQTLYDIQPTVVEATGNKHLSISPGVHVEKIQPSAGIRYTAVVRADKRLRKGMAKICVSVVHANRAISKVTEFNIPTEK